MGTDTVAWEERPAIPLTKEALANESVRLLNEVGWVKGAFVDENGYCMVGAMQVALGLQEDTYRHIRYGRAESEEADWERRQRLWRERGAVLNETTACALSSAGVVTREVAIREWIDLIGEDLSELDDRAEEGMYKEWVEERASERAQEFNDATDTTKEQVVGALQACAKEEAT